MATPTRLVDMPVSHSVDGHQIALRRSVRLLVRNSSPSGPSAAGGSRRRRSSRSKVDSSSSHGTSRSRSRKATGRPSKATRSLITNRARQPGVKLTQSGTRPHARLAGFETKFVPRPKLDVPRKRRRGPDLPDHATAGPLPLAPDLDELFRTPRALRALKRQRLSLSDGLGHTLASPIVAADQSTNIPRLSDDNLAAAEGTDGGVASDSALAADVARAAQKDARFRKEASRKLSPSGSGVTERASMPDGGREELDQHVGSDGMATETGGSDLDVTLPLAGEPSFPSLPFEDRRLCESQNVCPEASRPESASAEIKLPTVPAVPSFIENETLPAIASSSRTNVQQASVASTSQVPLPTPPPQPVPAPARTLKAETCDANIWKIAMQERVSYLYRRYGRDVIAKTVAADAERCAPPTEFRLYTPASYSERESDSEAFDESLIDIEMDFDDDDLWDEDDEDDDEDLMDVEDNATDGFEDKQVDATDDTSHVQSVMASNASGASSIPSTPTAPVVSFQLPRLGSIRVPYLDSSPLLTPDGRTFMGRGTPVDKQRRLEWANIPRPAVQVQYTQEEWFTAFMPASPFIPRAPSTGDLSYMDSQAVGAFCCTQQGTYSTQGTLMSSYGMGAGSPSISYSSPSQTQSWLDPSLNPSLSAHGLAAPPDAGTSMMNENFIALAVSAGVSGAAQSAPGCALHTTFLQCLMASSAGCMMSLAGASAPSPSPSSPAPPSVPSPFACNVEASTLPASAAVASTAVYDVAVEPVPVQASSTLSHALG
ncbi:uncharacterized protein LAESUDRAFT_726294 [Laetiporus sulphureus 93-53]|uniref:Uncharacterized protein n=1 Tax=Laetiporus sulphureus 93-53 TaxID=1314785 RepID=A0A165E1U7_9APHY|nr:uncharacterized protein LAESUDRAFT_726294 [Laetiporus sulphureus 93-53]KZT06082.1 hypothetical protein LAESUDRAFT_726294 [Laetiporus sulphureus 93-53]